MRGPSARPRDPGGRLRSPSHRRRGADAAAGSRPRRTVPATSPSRRRGATGRTDSRPRRRGRTSPTPRPTGLGSSIGPTRTAVSTRSGIQTPSRSCASRWYSWKRAHDRGVRGESAMPWPWRAAGRDGGDARHTMNGCRAPDVITVGTRPSPSRRVDDEIDLARGDQVDQVHAAPLADLRDRRHDREAVGLEHGGGPRRRGQREPELDESPGEADSGVLVAVGE